MMASGQQPANDDSVGKCVKFFKTLINLTHQNQGKYEANAVESVKFLIESVIGGSIRPDEFTKRIQDVLKSQTQPHLLPFIEKTLPALRIALINGEHTIEGIRYTGGQPPNDFKPSQIIRTEPEPIRNAPTSYEAKYQPPQTYPKVVHKMEVMEETLPQKQIVTASTTLNLPENMPYTTLNGHALISRLVEQVPNCEGVEQEVIAKISEVAESHLRELLLELSEIAGHRSEPLRMNQMYQQINDPRKQLKFIEEHEKQAFIRQETVEKEAILKASKAKTKDNAQKAKEIKNANQEEKLNREANEAAIAALGGNRTTKNWNRFDPMKAPIGQGMSTQPLRARTRRITIRDLQCAIECKNIPGNALIKSQLAYGLLRFSNGGQHESQQSDTI